jgi:protein TonB
MFESVRQGGRLDAITYCTSLLFSIMAHAAILAVIVILPLVFCNVLYSDDLVTFLIAPPSPPPPIPAPAPPGKAVAKGTRSVTFRTADFAPPRIPVGIAPPEESEEPLGIEGIVKGIGIPAQGGTAGQGLPSGLITMEPPNVPPPKPPTPRIPIRPGGNVQESKLILKVAPIYPELARRARVEGLVILEAMIDEEGNVADLKVLQGHPLLNEAAIQAVKQWKYSPTVLNGEPVPVLATVTVIFRLQ